MFDWIKKHIKLVGFISAIIILGVPFLIHVLFKIDSGILFFRAEWTAGDVLGYYGSILSFIGTVVLGVLALYQNKIIREETNKREALLEQREHEKNSPKFNVIQKFTSANSPCISFEITNISENTARDVRLYDIMILDSNGSIFWKEETSYSTYMISTERNYTVTLDNPDIKSAEHRISIRMKCNNEYGETYNYTIVGTRTSLNQFFTFKMEKI